MSDDIALPPLASPVEKAPEEPPVVMDNLVKLLAEDVECANNIKWWQERRRMVQERIAEAMGDSVLGTVNGRDAVHYDWVQQFNGSAFAKEYPDMARVYTHSVMVDKLDLDALRRSRPDLYRQFQTRKMRVVFEPPGATDPPEVK